MAMTPCGTDGCLARGGRRRPLERRQPMTHAVRVERVVLFCGLLLATAGPLAAQQPSSIIGKVTDETGALLAGVSVVATSPALQVPQIITVTDQRGEYRL